MKWSIWLYPFILFGSSILVGCKKFITVNPPTTQLVSGTVFTSDATVQAALTGIYSKMMESPTGAFSGGSSSIGPLCGLAADELTNYNTTADPTQFYQNAVSPNNGLLTNGLWGSSFQYLYAINSVMAGVDESSSITPSTKSSLVGQAKFLRAFTNFYLLQLFDSIPLILTTDYQQNQQAVRAPVDAIWTQIQLDLAGAATALSDQPYSTGAFTPTIYAVRLLQARVALYLQHWTDAQNYCNEVMAGPFSLQTNLNQVFLPTSTEIVWQLSPVVPEANSWDGFYYILLDIPSESTISPSLLNAFEPGDQRRLDWVDSITVSGITYYFPYKYKVKTGPPVTENQVVFRLTEIVLVQAECLAEQGDLAGADADINEIRARAGLSSIHSVALNDCRAHILQERRVELFTEWGHRWFDLKRTGTIDAVLGSTKSNWKPTDAWFPIPQTEIQKDPGLTQNAGY